MTLVRRSFILSLLFGIWAWFAETTGLVTWAGAAGCTTYFACCGCGQDAQKGIWSNLSGIFWASLSLWLTDQNVNPYLLMTIFTFIMCIQSIHTRLSFTSGTFIGCFCTFAADGPSTALILSLLIGNGIGLASIYLSDLHAAHQYRLNN